MLEGGLTLNTIYLRIVVTPLIVPPVLRYLIALMSFFSLYAGLIYNDVFSKSLNIFGSSWYAYQSKEAILSLDSDMISPYEEKGWYTTPYPFGVDPIWQVKP